MVVSTNKTAVSRCTLEINNTSVHKTIFLWGVVTKVETQNYLLLISVLVKGMLQKCGKTVKKLGGLSTKDRKNDLMMWGRYKHQRYTRIRSDIEATS